MEIGELGNTLAADVLKFWMDSENRTLVNHQVEFCLQYKAKKNSNDSLRPKV
jgi:hypothetical protein